MKNSDTPQMFAVPFGAQADNTTITTIPQSKTAIGRASMALGFPKETFTPIAAGGVPPYGEDMNGILNMLAQAARAAEAGLIRPFSQTYANEINGYPLGSIVAHPSISGRFVMNSQDNNTSAPPGNGWVDPLSDFVTNEALSGSLGNYATTSALQEETQRAEAAEAALLPLSGGQMTGQITTNIGGTIPQIVGTSGRIVFQTFTIPIGSNNGDWIAFPQAFTQCLQVFVNSEHQNSSPSSLAQPSFGSVTNSGFRIDRRWIDSGSSAAEYGGPKTYVLAIGIM